MGCPPRGRCGHRVFLTVGARDLDPAETEFLDRSRILALSPDAARDPAEVAWRLDALAGRVQRVYLHVDLDVHDPNAGRANTFQPRAGLTAKSLSDSPSRVTSTICATHGDPRKTRCRPYATNSPRSFSALA